MTFTIIVRSTITYLLILVLMRIMGKRQIGELQPFELVITIIFADLATIPMADTALPLAHGIIPLLTLVSLHFLLCFWTRKSISMRNIINGKPVIVIDPAGINYKALKILNMNFSDLQESLRTAGYFNIDEVLYAIIQTNGTLSVLPRAPYSPLTANDLELPKQPASLPIIIVSEGKIIKENMSIAKLDENFINTQIISSGFKSIKEILMITINTKGKMYIQPKCGNFVTRETSYNGDGNW